MAKQVTVKVAKKRIKRKGRHKKNLNQRNKRKE